METQIAFPAMVKEYRLSNGLTMEQLAEKIGKTKSTISKWESGSRSPKIYEIEEIANFFGVAPEIMMFGNQNPTLREITSAAEKLEEPRQINVLDFTKEQLNEQRAEKQAQEQAQPVRLADYTRDTEDHLRGSAIAPHSPTDDLTQALMDTVGQLSPDGKKTVLSHAREVLEREEDARTLAEPELFKIYYVSEVEAGPTGYSYDDLDQDYCYTDEEPPRYDIATKVHGWSMAPDYDEGDILYLRDYGTSHYSGQECVVVVDDRNYFKKVYTTDTGLLLVSINDDKDTYPDFEIPFPPEEDTHIKIFNVVGSFVPVEG